MWTCGSIRAEKAEAAVAALREHCRMVKVLGRYRAA